MENTRDFVLARIQTELGFGLTAMGAALNKFLDNDIHNVKKYVLPSLVNSAKYISQAHYLLSEHRRHQIYPRLSTPMQKVAKECQFDIFLFGENFAEQCKSATTIKKTSMELKIPSKPKKNFTPKSSSNDLNWQRPFTKSRFKKIQDNNYAQYQGGEGASQESTMEIHQETGCPGVSGSSI